MASKKKPIDPPFDSTDAMLWAESFVSHVKLKPTIATDAGAMVGWFANAMRAEARSRHDEADKAYHRGMADASSLLGIPQDVS